MPEVTAEEVAAAEARLEEARDTLKGTDGEAWQSVKDEVVALRSAWRSQEEQAGRRTGLVGGDAVPIEE